MAEAAPQVLGTRADNPALLEVSGLKVKYGAIEALKGVGLKVNKGEVVALIGANGAGKTSTLRAVSGMLKPAGGTITLGAENITGHAAHTLVPKGMAHAPEGRGIFPNLTVQENLDLGAYLRKDPDGIKADAEKCFGFFPVLKERRPQMAGTLSGGEQQMLAISRALMLRPKLLLLDEPSFGLAPLVVGEIFRIMRDINEEDGVTMLVVEQNASLALDLAHHAYLLETGSVALSGSSEEVSRDESVRRTYLGY
jgi:branched-chain amino acid transport system ATP-binding protein